MLTLLWGRTELRNVADDSEYSPWIIFYAKKLNEAACRIIEDSKLGLNHSPVKDGRIITWQGIAVN